MYSDSRRALMVINVYAPDPAEELRGVREVHADAHKGDAGRTEGGRQTVIRGWGSCIDDSDDLKEIYGPQVLVRWTDPGGLKKALWLEILTEFNCKSVFYLIEL